MEQLPGTIEEPVLRSDAVEEPVRRHEHVAVQRDRSQKKTLSRAPSAIRPTRKRITPWSRRGGIFLMCCYVTWSFVIPIKNVLMIQNPKLRLDSIQTDTDIYAFNKYVLRSSTGEITGSDMIALLRQVIRLVIGKHAIRQHLEASGSFDIDTIHHLLDPNEFQILSMYYSLILQATEFPAGTFTPRPRHFVRASAELPLNAIGTWIVPSNGSDPWLLTVSCAAENAAMEGTQCMQSSTQHVCYDFPVAGEQRSYTPISLNDSRINSGLGNSIELMHLVGIFHGTMAAIFATRSWNRTLDSVLFRAPETTALTNGFSNVYRDGIPMMSEKAAMDTYSLRVEELTTRTLESCFYSMIITLPFYIKAFVLDLVEQEILEIPTAPYGVNTSTRLQIPRDRIRELLVPVLAQKVHISSGARVNTVVTETKTKIFTGLVLTSITKATARLKFDKKLQTVEAFGSNLRMLLLMARYPEYYSLYERTVQHDQARDSQPYDAMTFTLLGGAMSGLNTFKGDWWGNTMGVFRLAELPHEPEAPRFDSWWDEEAKFAGWFQRLEQSSDAPFHALAKLIDIESLGIALDDDPVTRCHRAFFKTLAKIVWLSLLTASAQPTYLMYMSNVNGGARAWFVNMIKRSEMVGETINGARYSFSYSGTSDNRKDDGSAWVFVPLVQAMLDNFGSNHTTEMILREYNASFPLLVTTEYGLVHFPDSSQCRIGFKSNNVSAETNTIEKITTKFYPSVKAFVKFAVERHGDLHARMSRELAAQGVKMVQIPKEMLMGSPSAPNTIGFVGSPVFWKATALTAGLLKFWPAATPPPSIIEAYRNATVCYRTLELRYLNESVRCWVEPNSVTRSRTAYDSVGLRYLIWSNWSISWVLNCIAVFIAIQHLRRFAIAYTRTKFQCVSFWVAAQFNFQSVGVLTGPQVMLMTLSAVPIMVAYHLPSDPMFMEQSDSAQYPKLLRESLIALSATWFIRMGYDIVNQCVELHEIYPWLNRVHPRAAALTLVFVVRMATPDRLHDANYEMSKLLITCVVSIALGMLCAIIPIYVHHRRDRKIMPTEPSSRSLGMPAPLLLKPQSAVIKLLQKEQMPLNHHGLLGFSQHYGWSLTGLIVEGWEIVEQNKKENEVFLTKGRCKLRLKVDDKGTITQCLL